MRCQSRPSELDNHLIIEKYATVTVECDQHAHESVQTVTRSQLSIHSIQDRLTQPSTSAAASTYDLAPTSSASSSTSAWTQNLRGTERDEVIKS